MRECLKKQYCRFKSSRTGAAMLMVLLVTVFVVITGSSVMFTSYNSYMMRLVDREGVDTFYETEDLVDLTRVLLQEIASKALEESYTRVMAEYAIIQAQANYVDTAVQEEAQRKFNQYFIEELAKSTSAVPNTVGGSSTDKNVFLVDKYGTDAFVTDFNSNLVTGYYSTSSLEKMLSDKLGTSAAGDVVVQGASDAQTDKTNGASGSTSFDNGSNVAGQVGEFTFTFGDDGYPRLVLESLNLSYVTDSGYQTNITTDIVIEMPMFTHTGDVNKGNAENDDGSKGDRIGLPFDNASSIGRLWVKSSVANVDMLVTGDIYGGVFFTYDGGSGDPRNVVFSHSEGRLITYNGDVRVSTDGDENFNDVYFSGTSVGSDEVPTLDGIVIHGGTKFTSTVDSEVWSNSVSVRPGSDVDLKGIRQFITSSFVSANEPTYDWMLKEVTADDGSTEDSNIYEGDYFGGTFVKNDIIAYGGSTSGGNNNSANLSFSGSLYGFSRGTTAATSSALILNGNDINLNMNGIKDLIFGGTAYLEIGRATGVDAGDVLSEYALGQSMASAPDMLAYLVPTSALKNNGVGVSSNPAVFPSGASFTGYTIDFDATDSQGESLLWVENYVKSTPIAISRVYNSETIVYYFYDFVDAGSRTAYIAKYAAENNDFKTNLDVFVNSSNITGLGNVAGAGIYYYKNADGKLVVVNTPLSDAGGDSSLTQLKSFDTKFTNASVTLWPDMPSNGWYYPTYDHIGDRIKTSKQDDSGSPVPVDNPFDYYVNMQGDNLVTHAKYSGEVASDGISGDLFSYFDPDYKIDDCGVPCDYCDFMALRDPITNGIDNVYIWPGHTVSSSSADYMKLENEVTPYPVASYVPENYRRIGLNYWCRTDAGQETNDVWEFILDGRVVAVYRAAGLTYGLNETVDAARYPDVIMLLSRAGINIHDPFTGLALSETGIALVAEINSHEFGFEDILNAACTNPYTGEVKYLYEFFRNLDLTGGYEVGGEDEGYDIPGVSEDDSKVNWSPNDLVYYENWERH